MVEFDPVVRDYYEQGKEAARLFGGSPSGPLELERTKELILRALPDRPLRILDVGGGPGVYAAWLAELGHQVHLVDPVALHVEQAAAGDARIVAELGDARRLTQADASVDVVLLLGPLYHLPDRDDRLTALCEAERVLRPGGFLIAAAIARFAALLDLLIRRDALHEPGVLPIVADAVRTGRFRGGAGLFTNAYFHLPQELLGEIAEAGFIDERVYSIEGPGALVADFEQRWADPARRQVLLDSARLVESDPNMLAVGGHLLAIARHPS